MSFSIALCLSGFKCCPSAISDTLGIIPDISWEAGTKSKNGRVYDSSYWMKFLTSGDEDDPEDAIIYAIEKLHIEYKLLPNAILGYLIDEAYLSVGATISSGRVAIRIGKEKIDLLSKLGISIDFDLNFDNIA